MAVLGVIFGDIITSATYYANVFVLGAISLILGSFLSTFATKDKKIQYGMYTGIIFIIFKLFANVFNMNIVHINYYIIIISIIGYLLVSIIGSYLATNRKLNSFH